MKKSDISAIIGAIGFIPMIIGYAFNFGWLIILGFLMVSIGTIGIFYFYEEDGD